MKISALLSFLLGSAFRMHFEETSGGGGGDPVVPPVASTKAEMFSKEYVHELREENKSWRTKLNERDTAVATEKARADAAEAARDAAKAEAETAAQQKVMRAELKYVAAKHGLVDMDALNLLDLSTVKFDDKGNLVGADELFEATKKSKPYLFGTTNTSSTSKTPPPNGNEPKDVRKAKTEDYEAEKAAYLKSAKKR